MANIKEYWDAVRVARDGLPDVLYVMSLDNREKGTTAGVVSEVDREIAARAVVEKTHRVATSEEIQTFLDKQEAIKRLNAEEEMKRNPNVALPGILSGLVRKSKQKNTEGDS